MATKVFNFPTTFDGMIMSHKISDRITVVTNLRALVITIVRDFEVIDTIDCAGMTLTQYGELLSNKLQALEPVKPSADASK